MLNRMAKQKLRSTLLIGSAVAALAIGTGMGTVALAQPGAQFQDQGNRDETGPFPELNRGAWAYHRGDYFVVPRYEMRHHLRRR